MRIGIVCYPTYGGSGVVATELGMALAKSGHKIHFITYKRPARLNKFHENIYFHEVSGADYPLFEYAPYETSLASKLVDVIKYENLDVLHVHYAIPHAAVAYMAKQVLKSHGIKIPVVTTLHGTDITLVGADKTFGPVVEFSINNSDGTTAVSKMLKDETENIFNINEPIEVIYNFIDFDRFRKVDKNHFRMALAPDGERVLIHVSNFRKVKRVDDVIKVFNIVQKKFPAKLLLVGDGPERNVCEALCRELGVCQDVRFLGKQDAVEELLAIADVFIIPSQNESFGLAALEAMACEVPVVSSNIGGLPEVNIEGHTGFLCDVGDIETMAEKVIHILEDENRHKEFRKNALEHARKFDIQYILPQYVKYYEQVIAKVAEEVQM